MKFSSEKVVFGRHETFALRYSWLTKGLHALDKKANVFDDDDSVVHLGVGRNMVSSIRYWLRACQLISFQKPDEIQPIAKYIFDKNTGADPYLEDEATIWLVHWLLATNSEMATSWFWFFNKFHKPEFTSEELETALTDFINDQVTEKKRPKEGTIKKDAHLLTRMYTQSRSGAGQSFDDMLDSPLALLGLISESGTKKSYNFKPEARPELPIGIFGFAVAQLMEERDLTDIPIEDLMYSKGDFTALGSVFRLTESDLITKLELVIKYIPNIFKIDETAGMHRLFRIKAVDPMSYIKEHYADINQKGKAA